MNGVLIIFIAVILSAFFSGMEIAFLASNKLLIELDRKQGVFGSEILKLFTRNPGQYISTMLVGNNIALVIYGLVFSDLLGPVLSAHLDSDFLILLLNTLISTSLILFVAEFLPKTIFIISPNFFLKYLSIPTLFFYALFFPITKFTLAASNIFIRIFFRMKISNKMQENTVFSKIDLDHLISMNHQGIVEHGPDTHNIRIFQNALDFSNVRLRECMVPRTEIKAIGSTQSIGELKELFIGTGHSRILVYQNSVDNVIGYFELKDIFANPRDIISCLRKVSIVPETMAANKLLKLFVEDKINVALVVDEFGGTSGMVTIEDVLEEIVGNIEDEHDYNELTEKKINDKEFIFSGRHEVDYLNEKYNLSLPEEDDYETLAGMVLFYSGSIPALNDVIRIDNIVIKVLRVSATRLELVNLKIE